MSYLLGGLAILGLFAAIYVFDDAKHRRMAQDLLRRRKNPTKEEFVALLAGTCDPTVAEFLWDQLLPYFKPILAPHPDDDFILELRVDPDEPNDWLSDFCRRFGIDEDSYALWPESQPTTVRNFAEWLATGRPNMRSA